MATAHWHFTRAEELLADITTDDGSIDFGDGGEAFAAAALIHATLAHAAALGANEELLPSLDDYCLCPTELRAETFTHADDCPHSKESPAVASAEDS
jgi:hypothetical protein